MKIKIITIDGPAASGKEKISKYISKKWKFKHLDSGILYRRLAYIFKNDEINTDNISDIKKKLKNINTLSFRKNKNIRSEEIGKLASKIAIYNPVRDFVNKLQYNFW